MTSLQAPTEITRRTLLGALCPALVGLGRAQSRPPNFLFFLTDDQRWDAAGFMGNPILRTPHMDRLASRGTVFTNAFVSTSICMTSRASILTGLYARAHQCNSFSTPLSDDQFASSFPGLLRAASYRTGYIGKWGVGPDDQSARYDFFRSFRGQGPLMIQQPDRDRPIGSVRVSASQAGEFLRGCTPQQPFCLQVSYNSPHAEDNAPWQYLYEPEYHKLYAEARIPVPLTADREYWSSFPQSVQRSEMRRRWAVRFATPELYQESVKRYYRLITALDESIGTILAELERTGMADNTVVIFASDNGYYLGEYGFADKWLMHEPSIRIPLFIYDPRQTPTRRRLDSMALNIDLAPTMLELAGLAPPPSMQGRSLVPLLRGSSVAWRQDFFYEHWYRHNGWIPGTEGVRTTRWKYTRYLDTDPLFEELYDLREDPNEQRNLAGSAHPALEPLRQRWSTWTASLERWKPGESWKEPPFPAALR